MSDDRIEVQFSAKTADLDRGSKAAVDAVEKFAQSTDQAGTSTASAWAGVGNVFQGVATTISSAFSSIGASAGAMESATHNAFAGVAASASGVPLLFGGIAAIAATAGLGLAALGKRGIDAADDMNDMSQRLGIAVEQLAGYKLAAESSGTSLEGMATGVKKLSMNLTENSEKLRAVGITATDADGALRQIADKFAQMPDGAQKTAVAMALMGRSGADMIPLLNGGGEALQQMIDKGRELYPVTTKMAIAADAFNDRMKEVGTAMSGVSIRIGNEMLPKLRDLIRFTDQAIERWGVFGGVFTGVLGGGVLQAFGVELNDTKRAEKDVEDAFKRLSQAKLAMRKAEESGSARGDDLARFRADVAAAQKELTAAIKARNELVKRDALEMPKPAGSSDKKDKTDWRPLFGTDPNSDAAKEKTQMPNFEATLAETKLVYAKQNDLRQMSKEDEVIYWREILDNYQISAKDRIQISKKTAELELAILHDKAKQSKELKRQEIDEAERVALDGVASEELNAANSLATFGLTNDQMLELQRQFEERKYQIQAAAQAARVAMVQNDPTESEAAKQAQLDKLLDLTRQYQLKRQQLENESSVQSMQIWQDLANSASSLWDKGIDAMMNGTLRWRNAFRAIGMEVVGWFGKSVVKPIVMEWITGETTKTAATYTGTAMRWAAETAAAAKSVALWAATAVKNIMSSAWEAMAGAWKAMVGIPYVGPFLAVGAAAAAFAGVSALAGNISSAEGGFDIPRGMNPITQLHQEEMVLPAQYANVIRGMAAGGGSGGGGGVQVTVNQHLSAWDSRDARRALLESKHHVAEAMERAARDGWRPKT